MAEWTVPATVMRVIDADSARLILDLGWRISYEATVRIEGIDAPELITDAGRQARDFAAKLLPTGTQVVVTSHSLDKYGRVLGSITLPDGSDYAGAVVAAGHAQPHRAARAVAHAAVEPAPRKAVNAGPH